MPEPRIRRSMLMTPGNRPERLAKAASYGADALIFDLEDSVPPAEKARARQCVAEALRAMPKGGLELCVRINSINGAHGVADIAGLPLDLVDSLMIPKVESPDILLELERRFSAHDNLELIVTLETPRGILNALAIADATPRTTALFFGSGDYTSAIGTAVTDAVQHFPRSVIVAAAAAAGCQPIDAAFFADVKNAEATRRDALVARELGFVGKVVFHPTQVAVANEVFSPTRFEIARARLLLSSYRESLAKGLGTSVTDGVFAAVDLVPPAERLIRMAEMIAKREKSA